MYNQNPQNGQFYGSAPQAEVYPQQSFGAPQPYGAAPVNMPNQPFQPGQNPVQGNGWAQPVPQANPAQSGGQQDRLKYTPAIYEKPESGKPEDLEGAVIDPSYSREFISELPFEFTEGQASAWNDISSDLSSSAPMNRLIQGDVGSGKTALAEAAMYCTVRSGYQAVMMAPTEILAKQHYKTLIHDFDGFDVKIALLTGSMKQKDKNITLEKLANGDIDILIGTHALIEPGVRFCSLGLAITDEQHRFGVEQRHLLSSKGEGINIMVMTATPIPRTLAVIIYGDLDISQIRTMPEGRKKIITKLAHSEDRMAMYDFIKKKMRAALCSALSMVVSEGRIKVVDNFDLAEIKTKTAANTLNTLNVARAIIVDSKNGEQTYTTLNNDNLRLSVRNLQNYKYLRPEGVNVYDILHYGSVIVTRAGLEKLEARLKG